MTKVLSIFSLVLLPILSFAETSTSQQLTTGGIINMVLACSIIIAWNIICFKKILSK